MEEYLNILSAVAVAAVLGLTQLAKRFVRRADGTLPQWFLAFPAVIGLIAGGLNYFVNLDPAQFADLPTWKHVVNVVMQGLGFAGAAVLIFEAKKAFLSGGDEPNT